MNVCQADITDLYMLETSALLPQLDKTGCSASALAGDGALTKQMCFALSMLTLCSGD